MSETPGWRGAVYSHPLEADGWVCRHGHILGEHWCDDLADHYAAPTPDDAGGKG